MPSHVHTSTLQLANVDTSGFTIGHVRRGRQMSEGHTTRHVPSPSADAQLAADSWLAVREFLQDLQEVDRHFKGDYSVKKQHHPLVVHRR